MLSFLISKLILKAYALDTGVEIPGHSGTTYSDYKEYIGAIYKFALVAGFSLATLMLIYAGYKYLTSQGNQTQITDAKDIMYGAIIGFVILLLANFVLKFLGYPTI